MWYFEKRDPYGVFAVPKHEEHFGAVRGIVQSLIREVCQNSADAAAGKNPVDLRFRFGNIDGSQFEPYIADLRTHLDEYPKLLAKLDNPAHVPFLAIEDFETTGLLGEYDPAHQGDSNYINFWHRYGESAKKKEKGGRHGLGKSTIASSSLVRFFFGVTHRAADKKLILQGQASLKQHRVAGEQTVYDAYGLFYGQNAQRRPIPIIDTAAVRFLHDFKLSRGSSPGLSLVIPYPHEDFTETSLAKEIIEHCFHQILSQQLVVRINEVLLSRATVRDRAEEYGLHRLSSAIDLSFDVTGMSPPKVFIPSGDDINARLSTDHFDTASIVAMRELWSDGKIVSVSLPAQIVPRNGRPQNGSVMLHLRREPNADLNRETYIRGRVSIPIRSMTDGASCVGLLVADEGIASTFLGDSEPPAHDRWLIVRLRDQYRVPEKALNRIKNGLRDLLNLLDAGEQNRPIKHALTEFLWFTPPESEEEDQEDGSRRPKNIGPPPQPPIVPIRSDRPHQLRKIAGGFAYTYRPAEGVIADVARIVVNYRRRKKPGKNRKYQDFDLASDDVEIHQEGTARLELLSDRNTFILQDVHPGFEMKVSGFDQNRDLELRLVSE